MSDYRFYMIGKDGHVNGPPTTHALPNDSAALEEAKKLVNGHDVEIWQGPRLVAYVVPDEK
jgi:hypothetical protein